MDNSPKERLRTLANIAFAIVQCPECMDGEISAADPKRDEAALRLASDAWKKGQFPSLSENDVIGMMRSVLSEVNLECSECASDISDDYDLKTMQTKMVRK